MVQISRDCMPIGCPAWPFGLEPDGLAVADFKATGKAGQEKTEPKMMP